jgi:hypothetical protein
MKSLNIIRIIILTRALGNWGSKSNSIVVTLRFAKIYARKR